MIMWYYHAILRYHAGLLVESSPDNIKQQRFSGKDFISEHDVILVKSGKINMTFCILSVLIKWRFYVILVDNIMFSEVKTMMLSCCPKITTWRYHVVRKVLHDVIMLSLGLLAEIRPDNFRQPRGFLAKISSDFIR